MAANVADERVSRGGRPRLSPEGRTATLTISINPHTRAALEEASARLGRSLSQTAEFAIERGRFLGDLGAAPSIAVAVNLMLRFAAEVQRDEGDPTGSGSARAEIREGWKLIAEHALTFGSDPVRRALAETQREALLVLSQLENLDRLGGSLALVAKTLQAIADGAVSQESPEWIAAHKELRAASEAEADQFVSLLLAGVHLRMLATQVDAEKPEQWAARGAERARARLRGMGVIRDRDEQP